MKDNGVKAKGSRGVLRFQRVLTNAILFRCDCFENYRCNHNKVFDLDFPYQFLVLHSLVNSQDKGSAL